MYLQDLQTFFYINLTVEFGVRSFPTLKLIKTLLLLLFSTSLLLFCEEHLYSDVTYTKNIKKFKMEINKFRITIKLLLLAKLVG